MCQLLWGAGPSSITSSHIIYTPGLLLGALISASRVPELCCFDFDLGERSCHMGRVVAITSEISPSVFPSALYLHLPLLQELLLFYRLLHSSVSQRHTMCFVLSDAESPSSLCYGTLNGSASIWAPTIYHTACEWTLAYSEPHKTCPHSLQAQHLTTMDGERPTYQTWNKVRCALMEQKAEKWEGEIGVVLVAASMGAECFTHMAKFCRCGRRTQQEGGTYMLPSVSLVLTRSTICFPWIPTSTMMKSHREGCWGTN